MPKFFNITKKKLDFTKYFLIIMLFLLFRIPGLGTDISNSDSYRWHRRSENFLTAIKSLDFKNTYQRYHPGVTLMGINSLTLQLTKTYNYSYSDKPELLTFENSDYYPKIHSFSKIAQVLFLCALFIYQLLLVSKIFNTKVAYFYGFLISLEPYLIGIDRWFHLTSLETYLTFTAFLSVLSWGITRRGYQLILTGFLIALAVLSKVTSLVVLPLLVLMIIYYSKNHAAYYFNKVSINKYLAGLALFIGSTFVFIFLFFPALWVAPNYVFQKIWVGISGGVYEDVRTIPYTGVVSYIYYLVILLIRLSPLTVLLLIFSLIINYSRSPSSRKYLWVCLYFLLYYVVLSISVKKIDRYVLVMIPPIILYISIMVSEVRAFSKGILVSVIAFMVFVFYTYYPVYSSYYSPILGDTPAQKALEFNLYDNSGEYFSKAALYANKNIPDSTIWVPFNRDAFIPYFKRFPVKEYMNEVEYAVVSIDHILDVMEYCPYTVETFGSKFEPYVYILKCKPL